MYPADRRARLRAGVRPGGSAPAHTRARVGTSSCVLCTWSVAHGSHVSHIYTEYTDNIRLLRMFVRERSELYI